jgi:hypothetical protein
MQNDPQDEIPIKKAWRTWRALREIKKEIESVDFPSRRFPKRLNFVLVFFKTPWYNPTPRL